MLFKLHFSFNFQSSVWYDFNIYIYDFLVILFLGITKCFEKETAAAAAAVHHASQQAHTDEQDYRIE